MFQNSNTSSHHSSWAYSISSLDGGSRQRSARTTLTKILNRQRSVTNSTSGSSVETATNGVTVSTALDVLEDQAVLDGTLKRKSSESLGRESSYQSETCASRSGDLELERSSSSLAAIMPNRVDSCHSATIFKALHKLDGKSYGHTARSDDTLYKAPSLDSEVETFQQTQRTSIELQDSLKNLESDDLTPLQTGPTLIHCSTPPWMESGRRTTDTGHLYCSDSRFGQSDQPTACLNHGQQSRQSPSQSESKAGLKKLLKSVKVTLWSTTSSPQLDTTYDKVDGHGPHGLLSSSNQSRVPEPSVKAHSSSTLALNHANHSSTVGPDDSTASLPRTISACSLFSIDTATTSTIPSASVTPSSSWSSLPSTQSDFAIADQSGPQCSKDQHPAMTISIDAGELGRHSTMATSHTLTCTRSPSHCFESSFGACNIQNKRDHPSSSTRVLKSKPSIGFLQNLKRAVTGVDTTLSFSFHNHLTPSLTTNAVSLPIGTVVRNNGLDPLPACHPLPLKSSQSTPSNLNYSLLTSTKVDPPGFESVPSPRPLSLFSPGIDEHSNTPQSALSHLPESIPKPELLRVPPKLNLRPVSMPFAASFSDQFLIDGLIPSDPQEQDSKDQNKTKFDGTSCAHHRHCPCCRSLADENARLKNHIQELERLVSTAQRST